MRRLLPTLALAALLAPALAACSGDDSADQADPTPTSTTDTPAPGAEGCDALISQSDAETLAATDLGGPQKSSNGGIDACVWNGDAAGVQALEVRADKWVKQLPLLVNQFERSGTKIPPATQKKLDRGLKLINTKKGVSPDAACALFSSLTTLQGQDGGSDHLTTVLPSKDQPQAVSSQACADGTYYSVTVAYREIAADKLDAIVARAEDALATLRG